jgi:hypothetical protein
MITKFDFQNSSVVNSNVHIFRLFGKFNRKFFDNQFSLIILVW